MYQNHKNGLTCYCLHNHTADTLCSEASNEVTQKSIAIAALTPRVTPKHLNNGLIGIENLGNTCYMNASLQALVHIKLLRDYFLLNFYSNDINVRNKHGYQGKLVHAYAKLVNDFWYCEEETLSPNDFYGVVSDCKEQFAGNEQHDASEFLNFLIDGLSEDLCHVTNKQYIMQPDSDDRPDAELADIWWENYQKYASSAILALFRGQYKSIKKCSGKCNYSSARYEPFTVLQVPIFARGNRQVIINTLTHSLIHVLTHSLYKVSIEECMSKFTEVEKMKEIICPICKKNNKLSNSISIWRPPPVLVVQLKRFQFDHISHRKLTNKVVFPLTDFDISSFLAPSKLDGVTHDSRSKYTYDLYSTVNHYEDTREGGHYKATWKSLRAEQAGSVLSVVDDDNDDTWYCFDDDNLVTKLDKKMIISESVYLLFYVRKDIQGKTVSEVIPVAEKSRHEPIDNDDSDELEEENVCDSEERSQDNEAVVASDGQVKKRMKNKGSTDDEATLLRETKNKKAKADNAKSATATSIEKSENNAVVEALPLPVKRSTESARNNAKQKSAPNTKKSKTAMASTEDDKSKAAAVDPVSNTKDIESNTVTVAAVDSMLSKASKEITQKSTAKTAASDGNSTKSKATIGSSTAKSGNITAHAPVNKIKKRQQIVQNELDDEQVSKPQESSESYNNLYDGTRSGVGSYDDNMQRDRHWDSYGARRGSRLDATETRYGELSSQTECRHFRDRKYCSYGDTCKFYHNARDVSRSLDTYVHGDGYYEGRQCDSHRDSYYYSNISRNDRGIDARARDKVSSDLRDLVGHNK